MPEKPGETRVLRLRIIAEAAPPEEYEGRWMEFGLQEGKQEVQAGQEQPDGSVRFEFEVQVRRDPLTGALRFRGPHVQGKPAEPFVYLSWKYASEPPEWKRRQKLWLAGITWEQVEAAKEGHAAFEATAPPITSMAGGIRVEWKLHQEGSRAGK